MNSQNRMNAGAEYVVYRIWAALQDQKGIHPESLLTCLGALAGYACQACVRQTAALPGADPRKYALRAVESSDGTTYLDGDALNVPLAESPLSVWALIGRAVQKLGKPLPDIEAIFRHVTQTVGTSEFGIPRVPDGHRPRQPAIVYLKQVWPQILPIAQRFCNRPAQIPVLFGIALQRAIEQTQDVLSPTLSASIAMECAVAMSKVALPGADANPTVTWPAAIAAEMNATPMLMASPGTRADATPIRAIRAPKRRRAGGAEASTPGVGALVARFSPAARIVAIVSLAIIAIAGVMYKGDQREAPQAAREPRKLEIRTFQEDMPVVEEPAQEAQAIQEQERPEEIAARSAASEEPADRQMNEDSQRQLDASYDSGAEMVIPAADLN